MTADANRHVSPWRLAGWGTAAALILLPLIAMRFTDEVAWTASDFVFAILLIGGVGIAYELVVGMTGNAAYRATVAVALLTGFLIVWSNLAVGIIGDEGNPANLAFFGILAIAITGAFLARLRPEGMARALFATAFAQLLVSAVALIAHMDLPVGIAIFFVGMWLVSGLLFRAAARSDFMRR
ncbi:hypothetical protein [Sphingomonas sp. Root241]|uniref:hypothetical protein n=1 Tax=Sphingomonas sp. Root241 TaxID=1736501 RepID=UPI0006F55703|nr:hypothetical protein [Sphingomonas sp. Root241]KRC81016.1 hypothetical protein ASE13_00860 [Sphingomonas sp. Root241]